jgi:chromosomal replication initiator protein
MLAAEQLWISASDLLKSQVSDGVWQSTFASVSPLELTEDRFVLGLPNGIIRDKLDGRYRPLVEDAVCEAAGHELVVDFQLVLPTLFDDPPPAAPPVASLGPREPDATPRFFPDHDDRPTGTGAMSTLPPVPGRPPSGDRGIPSPIHQPSTNHPQPARHPFPPPSHRESADQPTGGFAPGVLHSPHQSGTQLSTGHRTADLHSAGPPHGGHQPIGPEASGQPPHRSGHQPEYRPGLGQHPGSGGGSLPPAGVGGLAGGPPSVSPEDDARTRYTFEGFVIGPSNRFAHAAALSVAERPGGSYNPLFIYGSAGLGKTHILKAIEHFISDVYPRLKVLYVSTETFLNEFVDSIRNSSGADFKRRYRQIDVLLIDDIQFIEGKDSLQEELFHTFNDLYGANRQIVLSSDRPPDAIPTLEERLKSRFMMGLLTDIQPPDIETRMAILRKKADRDGHYLPNEVSEFIATNITSNIRELEGALNKVTAFATLNGQSMSRSIAEQVLGDFIAERQPRPITVAMILETTSEKFGFTIDDLKGKSRRRPLVITRQMAMYVTRQLTDLSFPVIAREFGGRDHTTVMHACDKISALMKERSQIYNDVMALEKKVLHQAQAGDY